MEFNQAAVIGAGTMGRGIAEMLALRNVDVRLADKSPALLQEALTTIEQHLDSQIRRYAMTVQEKKLVLSKIRPVHQLDELRDCLLAIECVVEQLKVKKELLRRLEDVLAPDAIIASNTASLSLTELAAECEHPERIIGLHFLYPADKTSLVEIIRGLHTSDDTFDRMNGFAGQLGKTSIQVFEAPGFVTTRLICVLINEALHTLAEGVATAEEIDLAMKLGYDFKNGPLEMADRFGLDSVLASMEALFRECGDLKYRPGAMLKQLVRANRLGVKTGTGFFRYNEGGERQ